jgi:hypothetical protein
MKPTIEIEYGENIFAVAGRAGHALMRVELKDDYKKLVEEIKQCETYDNAIDVIKKYVFVDEQ